MLVRSKKESRYNSDSQGISHMSIFQTSALSYVGSAVCKGEVVRDDSRTNFARSSGLLPASGSGRSSSSWGELI